MEALINSENNCRRAPDAEKILYSMKSFLFDYFHRLGPDPDKNIKAIVDTVGKVLKPDVALYNRLWEDRLVTSAIYNAPDDYQMEDSPGGHICYEMTIRERDRDNLVPVVLNDIEGMRWQLEDSNVRKYDIKSYMACPVALEGKVVGSLCIVNTQKKIFSRIESDILESFAKAVTLEEERQLTISRLAEANSELEKNNQVIEKIALTDPLTSLSNRRDILKKINFEVSGIQDKNFHNQKRRDINHFVIALADIDYFKRINDLYGHDCGDYILVEISKIMQNILRAEDHIARWGGEEFLIILTKTDISGGYTAIEKLRRIIESTDFCYNGNNLKATLTFGLIEYSDSGHSIEEFIKSADLALYQGKEKGRNCSVIFSE